jgi:hypothetical protein
VAGLLEVRHPGQQPSVIAAALRAKVLEATRRKPADGSTHWSCRKMARHLKISKDTVQRIWRKVGLKPHRLERYMAIDDPDFERKAADILGLYLHPPQHAAVFCVDEKSAIQALDRLDPVLPMSPGRIEHHGFEYFRHGTLSLYAALDVRTGKVQGKTVKSSWAFSGRLSMPVNRSKRCTSSSTTCRPTKRPKYRPSSTNIRTCASTSRPHTPLG